MLVIGIDQAVRGTGVCVLDTDGTVQYLGRVSPPATLRGAARLQYIRDSLTQVVSRYPEIQLAVMEGYSYNSTNKKFLLGEVGAVVKLVISDKNITLLEVAPKQLKKFVTNTGSADKEAVKRGIYAKWQLSIDQDDEADACGLAQVARSIILNNSNNRAELEVLKKLSEKELKKPKRRGRLTPLINSL